ncbi:hypothetical protein NOX90_00325 [Wolbachia endosymbiont of Anurida maritima]|uniref:hypothetical protein n=1 Tax=Wolbachia endosymbiont of Anurida maritima TaxID=2850562 RepID=UPI0035D0790F
MNNYSKQESEKAMSEMRDFDYKEINNLVAKIRPKNFEDIKDNPVSASYVNVIIEKFINDFNEIFVSELNDEFHLFIENLNRIQGEIVELETINHNNIDGWE